jgi:hypothetical protein
MMILTPHLRPKVDRKVSVLYGTGDLILYQSTRPEGKLRR